MLQLWRDQDRVKQATVVSTKENVKDHTGVSKYKTTSAASDTTSAYMSFLGSGHLLGAGSDENKASKFFKDDTSASQSS